MSVKNAMTKDVVCVKASHRVKDAWLIMMEANISGAPVIDDAGVLVGILSNTDIFRCILERLEKARSLREITSESTDPAAADKEEIRELTLAIRALAESPVTSVLPKDQKLYTLSPEDSLDRAVRMMAEHNVNRLPVVKDSRVVGIITRQDVIWILAGRPG